MSKALWDTGSTATSISRAVVEELNLCPTGTEQILSPTGSQLRNVYTIDIKFNMGVTITDIKAYESDIDLQGIDILIGMDIICLGDFAVSNYGGRTQFTFRYPSQEHADYRIWHPK